VTQNDQSPLISRRHVLGLGVAGASALAVSGMGLTPASASEIVLTRNGLPRDPADSGIEHVVVVMMENRSFDHILGWLPGARGKQLNRFRDRDGFMRRTWHLDTFTGEGFSDPSHSFTGGRTELNGGKCDGWLLAGDNDMYSIGYYLPDDLPFYGNAAPYWTVCDRFFASFLGPTWPNRLYMHSAQTDRTNNMFAFATMPTIWERVAAAGLTGRYYYSSIPFSALWGGTLLPITFPFDTFLSDCAAGTLANLSFVDPRFSDAPGLPQNDDHPHADIRRGQSFLNQVYAAVSASPNWESTVLVITYDEWGGFFDHVRPNVMPDANPEWGQRGFRIPAIVISPRARRSHIATNPYDPTAILKMVEWRWGLEPLTPRDASARNLAEVLDFATPPDLTAPQWDVPDIDAPAAPSASAPHNSAVAAAQEREHAAELEWLGNMAAQHGFKV
jgi:phospholipase C